MPMLNANPIPAWQRAIVILSSTVVGFIVVLILQWSRPVLIPIALAVLLTFLMNPLVKRLHHRGLSHLLAVMIAVLIAGVVVMCLGWFVSEQVSGMLGELPRNTERIKAKVKTLKEFATGPTRDRVGQMIEEITEEIYPSQKDTSNTPDKSGEQVDLDPKTGTIVVREESARWSSLSGYVGSAVEILGTLALALVLMVFFLIEREDLRDRIVLLAGRARLALTSKALEDITDRISRYLSMVVFINGGFGIVLTVGLFLLGVPYALLWGFIAATLRFIPYLGPWIGAVFPITMSLALSDGWGQPLSVFVFVAVVELFTNNAVEPLLFGHTIGVSPTALLVSAASWLYLWGPIGLVLSAPFAVCLVVLGKNIPQLSFLYLLLCDKPALNADNSFYQRLMLGDFHEASEIALKRLKGSNPEETYDEMLAPVLNFTRRDLERGYLKPHDQEVILQGMQITLDKIAEYNAADTSQAGDIVRPAESPKKALILGCSAIDEIDQFALKMLKQLLDQNRWELEEVALETLVSELQMRVHDDPPDIMVITAVPPGGLAHSRYMCKRLRKAAPELPIVVVRSGQRRNAKRDREQLENAGANFVTTTLLETRNLLNARLPLLACRRSDDSGTEEQKGGGRLLQASTAGS